MINNLVLVLMYKSDWLYIDMYVFQILFPSRLLQNTGQSSLYYTIDPCWLSILNIAVHVTCTFLYDSTKMEVKTNKQIFRGKILITSKTMLSSYCDFISFNPCSSQLLQGSWQRRSWIKSGIHDFLTPTKYYLLTFVKCLMYLLIYSFLRSVLFLALCYRLSCWQSS